MIHRRGFIGSLLGLGALDVPSALAEAFPGYSPAAAPAKTLPKPGSGKPDDERYWDKVRELFYLPDDIVFLNNGSLGLSPRPVVDAMYRHLIETESMHGRKFGEIPWWGYGPSIEIRKKVASFVGADPDEIALTRNATEGMNTVSMGLDLNPGDEVLMTDQEHPGGKSAWYQRAKRYGIAVKEFEIPQQPRSQADILNRLEAALTPRTRVISVSHITTVTGGMLPVKEICTLARSRNIISLIDGAHAIGQLPLNLHDLGCDYYATSPHKWLYAPNGTGILYCKKGMAEKLWCHTASSGWEKPELGCERLTNIGTSNLSLLVGLIAAIELQESLGKDLIADRERYLNKYLRELLSESEGGTWFMNGPPPELSTAMVKAMLPVQKLGELPKQLWEKHRIWLLAGDGNDKLPASIRFSLPIFIRKRDLDRTVSLIREELQKQKA